MLELPPQLLNLNAQRRLLRLLGGGVGRGRFGRRVLHRLLLGLLPIGSDHLLELLEFLRKLDLVLVLRFNHLSSQTQLLLHARLLSTAYFELLEEYLLVSVAFESRSFALALVLSLQCCQNELFLRNQQLLLLVP